MLDDVGSRACVGPSVGVLLVGPSLGAMLAHLGSYVGPSSGLRWHQVSYVEPMLGLCWSCADQVSS